METITVLKVSFLPSQPIYNPINMIPTEWKVNSTESDVLLRARHSIVAYMAGSVNKFKGTLWVVENKVEFDAVMGEVVSHSSITKAIF
jgi:polyisoprenoid-binding protein YceI